MKRTRQESDKDESFEYFLLVKVMKALSQISINILKVTTTAPAVDFLRLDIQRRASRTFYKGVPPPSHNLLGLYHAF